MLYFYRFLRGYIKIAIIGDYTEKALNLCAANKISFWNSKIIKNGIETCIFIKDFSALRNIMRGSKLRVHILEKRGLPIKLYKNRKRYGLYIGAVWLFIFLKFMSGFIWIIDVEGNNKTETYDILSACKKIGITEGIKKDSINPKIKREELLLEIDTLAWAALNIEGSRLTVNVSEIEPRPNSDASPTNLLASADGIIKRIDITSGNCLVKTGDTVKKGDVLVSGIIETALGTRFVKSSGSIIAETTRSLTAEQNYTYIKEYETGKIRHRSVLELFTLKIPLYLGNVTEDYNEEQKINNLKLFENTLPIKIYRKEFRIKRKEKITLNDTEISSLLKENIEKQLAEKGVKDYTLVSEKTEPTDNGIKTEVLVKSTENIAESSKILISE